MPSRGLTRGAVVKGKATPTHAPIYVDSDDNILKYIPAGSGTTEVQVLDASATQTLTNKTLTAPTITDPTITGTVAGGPTITAPTLTSPVITGKPTHYSTVTDHAGDGAIDISLGDIFTISKGSAAAITLADPAVGDNGRLIHIFSISAFAHLITIAGGVGGGGSTDDVVTFTNRVSASISLFAHNGKWRVMGSNLAAIA